MTKFKLNFSSLYHFLWKFKLEKILLLVLFQTGNYQLKPFLYIHCCFYPEKTERQKELSVVYKILMIKRSFSSCWYTWLQLKLIQKIGHSWIPFRYKLSPLLNIDWNCVWIRHWFCAINVPYFRLYTRKLIFVLKIWFILLSYLPDKSPILFSLIVFCAFINSSVSSMSFKNPLSLSFTLGFGA